MAVKTRWQQGGGRLRTPDGEDGQPGPVPEPPGWQPLVGTGPFTTYWWVGPDRVEVFTWKRQEGYAELLTRVGWIRVEECERWPAPTEVLTADEANRRLGVPALEEGVHVRSHSYDACWRCGYDGRQAHSDRQRDVVVPCPGWTDYGIWARAAG